MKRPKPVISKPDLSKLRPQTIMPGTPRPAPAVPGSQLLPADLLHLGDNTRDELMAWLEERVHLEQTVIHPALRRPSAVVSIAPDRRPSSEHGEIFEPSGRVQGIIVHLGDNASYVSDASTYSHSSGSQTDETPSFCG